MRSDTEEWMIKALDEFELLRKMIGPERRVPAGALGFLLFGYHHVAELCAKALLAESLLAVPKVHTLTALALAVRGAGWVLLCPDADLRFLDKFAVGARYPGLLVQSSDLEDAERIAGSILEQTRKLLAIP